MKIYFDIIGFSFLRFFSYPFEILATVLKRIVEIFFLILFWSLITSESTELMKLSSYFFISMGVSEIVMSKWGLLGSTIGSMVKSGQLNNYLIKPIPLIPTIYSIVLGRSGLRMMLAFIYIAIGIIIFPPKDLVAIVFFIVFFVTAWSISFAYNLFEGILYLHFTEAGSIKNSMFFIIRLLSGALVPIYFVPSPYREIIMATPFPYMAYAPSYILSVHEFGQSVYQEVCIALLWAIVLPIVAYQFWQYSMKKYEAIGI